MCHQQACNAPVQYPSHRVVQSQRKASVRKLPFQFSIHGLSLQRLGVQVGDSPAFEISENSSFHFLCLYPCYPSHSTLAWEGGVTEVCTTPRLSFLSCPSIQDGRSKDTWQEAMYRLHKFRLSLAAKYVHESAPLMRLFEPPKLRLRSSTPPRV